MIENPRICVTRLFGLLFVEVSLTLDLFLREATATCQLLQRHIIAPGRAFNVVLEVPLLAAPSAYALARTTSRRFYQPLMQASRDFQSFWP